MKLLFVASEALPFASTGGLADVAGSLPAALKKAAGDGCDVRVVIPLYAGIREKTGDKLKLEYETGVSLSWRNQYCGINSYKKDNVTYYFIDNEYYFKRGMLYGSYDDGERFAYFGKAVMELMRVMNFYPDIMHANDWQTAPAVIYLKRKFAHISEYSNIKVLFTIHNIAYQGKYGFEILGDVFELGFWDRDVVEYDGCINLLKGAIVCADKISTVSKKYSEELMDEYFAYGLAPILRENAWKMTGITNGIDIDYYNPATDEEIFKKFSPDDISGKSQCKKELVNICGFYNEATPIISMVSRLAAHKGFDLVSRVIEEIICTCDVNFVLLGTGEREFEDFFSGLASRHPGRVCTILKYDKALSKKIYAGSDIFLMPSQSEPCGLSQMIASRYGTVPVVRETGGLYDTIHAYNKYDGTGNGFSFANYNAHEMMAVIKDAIELYHNTDAWIALIKNVMAVDFSWNASAKKYIELYREIMNY